MFAYKVEYVAYGGWYNKYEGTKTIHSNYDDIEVVVDRARREIAREGCFALSNVKIKNITKVIE